MIAAGSAPEPGRRGALLMLLGALLALLLALDGSGVLDPLHRASFDHAARWARGGASGVPALDPVVVGIDDAYVDARREPLALMHEDLALFFDGLRLGEARAVGVDIILPQKTARHLQRRDQPEFSYDLVLLRALHAASRQLDVRLGATWEPGPKRFRPIQIDFLAAARGGRESGALASVLICPDEDGVVRRLPGGVCQPKNGPPPLSYALAGTAFEAGEVRYIDFALGAPFVTLRFTEILAWVREGARERLRDAFVGRTVLLGSTLRFEDRLRAPLPLAQAEPDGLFVPGVLLHAQMLRSAASGGGLRPAPGAVTIALAAVSAALALLPRLRLAVGAMPVAALLLVGGTGFAWKAGIFFSPVLPLLTLLGAFLGRAGVDYWRVERERRLLRRSFQGFVSPQVLKALLDGRVTPDRRGESVRVAVLFADIRGFTTLAATRPPREIFALLNAYLARMTEAIHQHGGTIDKFIGDGIMVVFGYPETMPDPAQAALAAGQAMLAAVKEFNAAHSETPLKIGIGVHCGEVLAGAVGSAARYEFTVIGDVVNVAARLEEQTKDLQQLMVVSRLAWEQAGQPAGFAALGLRAVRGRGELELMGLKEE